MKSNSNVPLYGIYHSGLIIKLLPFIVSFLKHDLLPIYDLSAFSPDAMHFDASLSITNSVTAISLSI